MVAKIGDLGELCIVNVGQQLQEGVLFDQLYELRPCVVNCRGHYDLIPGNWTV